MYRILKKMPCVRFPLLHTFVGYPWKWTPEPSRLSKSSNREPPGCFKESFRKGGKIYTLYLRRYSQQQTFLFLLWCGMGQCYCLWIWCSHLPCFWTVPPDKLLSQGLHSFKKPVPWDRMKRRWLCELLSWNNSAKLDLFQSRTKFEEETWH